MLKPENSAEMSLRDPHERYLEFQTESLAAFERNRSRHLGVLTWGVQDLPFEEMRVLGPKYSADTRNILKGFRDVEGYIVDYILAGIRNLRRAGSIAHIHRSWGTDEFMHPLALDEMMKASGWYPQPELYDQMEEALEQIWTPSQHKGLYSPAGYISYSTVQERGTFTSYFRSIRHVREESGLPSEVTQEEKTRGMEIGISEGLRRIARVEVYHHGIFLEQLKLLYKYFPDHTLVVLAEVIDAFTMPAMHLIPGGRQFLRSLLRTGVYKSDTQEKEVILPTLAALGFPDRETFDKAVDQARNNVEDGKIQASRRLFPIPRPLRKWELETIAYNEWLEEGVRNAPPLETEEDLARHLEYVKNRPPYVSPFAKVG